MSRRGSSSSMSSKSDVNFDDLDHHQVFGFLDDDGSGTRSRSRSETFCLDLSPSISASIATLSSPLPTSKFDPRPPKVNTTKSRSPEFAVIKSFAKDHEQRSSDVSSQNSLVLRHSYSDSSFSQVTATATSTIDSVEPGRLNDSKRAKIQSSNAEDSDIGSGIGTGNTTVLVAALTSLKAQVKQLTYEKARLEKKAITAGSTIVNLEQKLTASEQSNALYARQLANTKESFQAKLMAREEEMSIEELTRAKEKETLFQHQQARFATDTELWKREIAALTKMTLDLKSENYRLQTRLDNEVQQREVAEANYRTLATGHASTCEDLRIEKERSEIEIQKKLASDAQKHTQLCQQLKEQVYSLQLEKEDQLSRREHDSQFKSHQNGIEKSRLLNSVQEIRGLHNLLHLSLVETRKELNSEVQKTQDVLNGIQQQASDFGAHQRDRKMIPQKERKLQPESLHKCDRRTINQLEEKMAKSTRMFEKKNEALKAKYRKQNDHLKITLAVRQGLTTDLQAKREQIAELERVVARLQLAKGKTDVKLKHSQQQILAIHKTYNREVKKLGKDSLIVSGYKKTNHVLSPAESFQEANNKTRVLPHEDVEESEWQEFVDLVAAYEAERQLHAISL